MKEGRNANFLLIEIGDFIPQQPHLKNLKDILLADEIISQMKS